MDESPVNIKLAKNEYLYLLESDFISVELKETLKEARSMAGEKYLVSLTSRDCEDFRAKFTARLAKVGFDPNYELTDEGDLLEGLIDKFHRPNF